MTAGKRARERVPENDLFVKARVKDEPTGGRADGMPTATANSHESAPSDLPSLQVYPTHARRVLWQLRLQHAVAHSG